MLFDINHIKSLIYFYDIWEYGTTLDVSRYNFFYLVFKCLCTINTRIGTTLVNPILMKESEYEEQNFLDLVKNITE